MYVTTDRDMEIDSTGDIRVVTDRDNIRQQHVNAAFAAAEQFEGQLIREEASVEFRSILRDELDKIDYITGYSIDTEFDPPSGLEATINTNAVDNPVEVSV